MNQTNLGKIIAPKDYGLDPILQIHDKGYIPFLQTCWDEWVSAGMHGEAIASTWPARRMAQKCPIDFDGKVVMQLMLLD